jgi:hypothetical protein
LFLKNRNISHCKKLVFNKHEKHILFKKVYTSDEYDECLKVLFDTFYEGSDDSKIRDNINYWLSIVNLYKLTSDGRVPTVQFRIQHSSADSIELSNASILYSNLINYAIELSTVIRDEYNVVQNYNMMVNDILALDFNGNTRDRIYYDIILTRALYEYYYGKQNNVSYYGALTKLSLQHTQYNKKIIRVRNNLKDSDVRALNDPIDRTNTGNAFLNELILSLDNIMLYKLNSFGKEFIGYGLSNDIIRALILYLKENEDYIIDKKTFDEKIRDYCDNYGLIMDFQ